MPHSSGFAICTYYITEMAFVSCKVCLLYCSCPYVTQINNY
ncbi:unnamed protein product [Chondrus crispus]|uniref:Uncharacterized protein n=1 Tax=Chondrus crispus TaxID=2769 RepID=R7Q9I9_CHOCR|nr:unnamed protein product [Chondrus crispus]CDF34724.1 unnamed protein product [Chondrus crispus]|eukprot:XP_005714543.1 unnamed protein product [Chondrus crispus]